MLLLLFNVFSLYFSINVVFSLVDKTRSLLIFYFISSLYFVQIPLFFDVLSVAFEYKDYWQILISDKPLSFFYNLEVLTLWRVSIFVFVFNSMVYYSFFIFKKNKKTCHSFIWNNKNNFIYMKVFLILSWIGFLLFVNIYGFNWELRGFGYIQRVQSSNIPFKPIFLLLIRIFITLSGVAIFFAIKYKRYIVLVLSTLPSLLIFILTTSKVFILPILVVIIYAYYSDKNFKLISIISFKNIIILTFIIFVLPILFTLLRNNSNNFLQYLPYPIHRDESLNILYYVFSNNGLYNEEGTLFTNIIRLVSTGVVPDFFIDLNFKPENDITRLLAIKMFGWEVGTLHPTIYGWTFIDMKWYGFIFAIFIGFLISIPTRLINSSLYVQLGYFVIGVSFLLISMRGSVQFAYMLFIYGILFLLIVHFIIKSLPRKRNFN